MKYLTCVTVISCQVKPFLDGNVQIIFPRAVFTMAAAIHPLLQSAATFASACINRRKQPCVRCRTCSVLAWFNRRTTTYRCMAYRSAVVQTCQLTHGSNKALFTHLTSTTLLSCSMHRPEYHSHMACMHTMTTNYGRCCSMYVPASTIKVIEVYSRHLVPY